MKQNQPINWRRKHFCVDATGYLGVDTQLGKVPFTIMNTPYKMWTHRMGITMDDAIRLSRELLERCPNNKKGTARLNYCREIINEGSRVMQEATCSVTFQEAVTVSLHERVGRRPSTLNELNYICKRILQGPPHIAEMQLRHIKVEHCYEVLSAHFPTPRQFIKARVVLHSIFACGMRHGWCGSNSVDGVAKPQLAEVEIVALSWENIKKLVRTAQLPQHLSCAAMMGVMLWAGVRPSEAKRLCWEDINWEENILLLAARHTKTGGARCITLQPVLRRWLIHVCKGKHLTGPICPGGWDYRWRQLRCEAEIGKWQQDVLRHTFASYHLKRFKDLSALQLEMGHSTPELLRTRYLNMRGITKEQARLFWSPKEWC